MYHVLHVVHIVNIIYFEFLLRRHACTCLVIVHHHFGNICPLFDPVTITFRPFPRIQDSSIGILWDPMGSMGLSQSLCPFNRESGHS